MPAHLARAITAFSLLILAIIVIAGVLSTHSSPSVHAVAGATAASAAAAAGQNDTHPSARASEPPGGIIAGASDACDPSGGSQCCTEPVDCIEAAIPIPTAFAATTVPALTFPSPRPIAPPTAEDAGNSAPRAPSLTALSISRT